MMKAVRGTLLALCVLLIAAVAVAAFRGCGRRPEPPPEEERASIAAQLGVSPERLVYAGTSDDEPPPNNWRVMGKRDRSRIVADVGTFRGRLATYGDRDPGREDSDPILPARPGLKPDEASKLAIDIARHFWVPDPAHPPVFAPTRAEFAPTPDHPDPRGPAIFVEITSSSRDPLVPQRVSYDFWAATGVCCRFFAQFDWDAADGGRGND
jgi:hypothetical protein